MLLNTTNISTTPPPSSIIMYTLISTLYNYETGLSETVNASRVVPLKQQPPQNTIVNGSLLDPELEAITPQKKFDNLTDDTTYYDYYDYYYCYEDYYYHYRWYYDHH